MTISNRISKIQRKTNKKNKTKTAGVDYLREKKNKKKTLHQLYQLLNVALIHLSCPNSPPTFFFHHLYYQTKPKLMYRVSQKTCFYPIKKFYLSKKETSYLGTAQQDKQISRTFLLDKGTFFGTHNIYYNLYFQFFYTIYVWLRQFHLDRYLISSL